jgi:hypothetical protein
VTSDPAYKKRVEDYAKRKSSYFQQNLVKPNALRFCEFKIAGVKMFVPYSGEKLTAGLLRKQEEKKKQLFTSNFFGTTPDFLGGFWQ